MTDFILIVSLALLAIGVALFIVLPFCRMDDDEQAPPVDPRNRYVVGRFRRGEPAGLIDLAAFEHRNRYVQPRYPTPLECAEARVAMGEPITSAARNEGVPLTELMDYLRVKQCQPAK